MKNKGGMRRGGLPREDWKPYRDDGGYPHAKWLKHFARRAYCPGEAARFLITDLPLIADQMPAIGVDIEDLPAGGLEGPGKMARYTTGGWSGAEDLIAAMLKHFWIEDLHVKWEKGGAFWFAVPVTRSSQDARPDLAMRM